MRELPARRRFEMNKKTIVGLVIAYVVTVLVTLSVLLGAVASGLMRFSPHDRVFAPIALSFAAVISLFFLFLLIAVGVWVYGDATRRGMEPLLWTLVAVLGPNLMGLVVYLVVRKPLQVACRACGEAVTEGATFCPRCSAPLHPKCGSCQTAAPEGALYCPRCGAGLTR
jgi:hypothetical protein